MITLDVQTLVDVLVELRSASMKTSTNITEENIKNLIDKYDMLFLGGKLNAIYSMELSILPPIPHFHFSSFLQLL